MTAVLSAHESASSLQACTTGSTEQAPPRRDGCQPAAAAYQSDALLVRRYSWCGTRDPRQQWRRATAPGPADALRSTRRFGKQDEDAKTAVLTP
jgi:hypothetical protein